LASSRFSSSGTIACQVGPISVAATPPRKRESYKGADQDPGLRQDHQRDADRRQEELDGAQELAAIENVGQDAGGGWRAGRLAACRLS